MKTATALLITGLVLINTNVGAASFDCRNAASRVEKLICADQKLSKLDEELAEDYAAAERRFVTSKQFRNTQRVWLRMRDKCPDSNCIRLAIERRRRALAPPRISDVGRSSSSATSSPIPYPNYGFCPDVRLATDGRVGCSSGGKGYSVCKSYLEYLNGMPKEPTCETPVPPDFKRPERQGVSVLDHLDWAYRIERDFRVPVPSTPPDFGTWRKSFTDELKAGRIEPHMYRVMVQTPSPTPTPSVIPQGSLPNSTSNAPEQISLLAYTRNRKACVGSYSAPEAGGKLDARWAEPGYVYYLLTGNSGEPLRKIGLAGVSDFQTEMLLYGGKPYFVRMIDAGSRYLNPSFYTLTLATYSADNTIESPYVCQLEPYRYRDGSPQ